MCGSMVDIQSTAAEIRQGKKKRRKKKDRNHRENIMVCPITYGDHNNRVVDWNSLSAKCCTDNRFKKRFCSAPQCSHCKRCISYSNSVCLSVCLHWLSHAVIVSKRLHVARCSLHCQIAKCVSTIRASEKSSIITNRKSYTSFPTSHQPRFYTAPNFLKIGIK